VSKNRNRPYTGNETTDQTEGTETTTGNDTVTETVSDVKVEVEVEVQEKEVVKQEPDVIEPVVKEQVQVAVVQPKSEGYKPVYKIQLELNNYAEAMDNKKAINPEEGGRWQYSLFSVLKSILNVSSQEEFNKEWNTVLGYFNENKDGIFNEKFMFRFPEHWSGSTTEYTLFRRLVYTIIQTAAPKGRKKALGDINMAMVTESMTEPQRNKLLSYYGL
jgi:hypothetical protein